MSRIKKHHHHRHRETDSATPELVDHGALVEKTMSTKSKTAMDIANRADELKLDEPNLMRKSTRTISRLRSCSIASRTSFLLAWVLTIVVVSYCEDYAKRSHEGAAASCEGRRVYVYNLSEVYNQEFVRGCATFKKGRDLCMYMEDGGMGRGFRFGPVQGGPPEEEATHPPWHNTWQFALELYFHERLVRRYPCVTPTEELADALFVPYYAGMDLSRRFTHRLAKRALYLELATWLQARPSWTRRRGRDHFMTLGRIASDFRRVGGDRSWGNEMLRQEAFKEMVVVSIERSSGAFQSRESIENEIAVPYPTYFHASSIGELRNLLAWLRQGSQRVSLVTMAAGQRQATTNRFRHQLMTQCGDDPRCTLLLCVGHESSPTISVEMRNVSSPLGTTQDVHCNNPAVLLRAMHRAVFCLQPPGDSPTRRSFFDAMLVGCIPVIFQKEAAWSQYVHHLPQHNDGATYSVYIPMKVASTSNVIDILSKVDDSTISEMRATIAKLVPGILYARSNEMGSETTSRPVAPDGFDIAIEAVLGRINLLRTRQLTRA